jgi:hypothetical protein
MIESFATAAERGELMSMTPQRCPDAGPAVLTPKGQLILAVYVYLWRTQRRTAAGPISVRIEAQPDKNGAEIIVEVSGSLEEVLAEVGSELRVPDAYGVCGAVAGVLEQLGRRLEPSELLAEVNRGERRPWSQWHVEQALAVLARAWDVPLLT